MGAMRKGLGGLAAVLLGLSGCWTTHDQMKPPPPPPEFLLPPADDPRFSAPPAFPEKTLNEGLQKKDAPFDPSTMGGMHGGPPGRPGGMGGMGGPGGGGY